MIIFGIPFEKGSSMTNEQKGQSCEHPDVIFFTCTKEQAMVPLLSWFRRVSHTATSGTLVTPSVIIMIPEIHKSLITKCDEVTRRASIVKTIHFFFPFIFD